MDYKLTNYKGETFVMKDAKRDDVRLIARRAARATGKSVLVQRIRPSVSSR